MAGKQESKLLTGAETMLGSSNQTTIPPTHSHTHLGHLFPGDETAHKPTTLQPTKPCATVKPVNMT